MNTEQIQETLDMLAVRFGATGEHLWGVLIRQQYVHAGTYLGVVVLCALLAMGFGGFGSKLESGSDEQEGVYLASLVIGIVGLIILVVGVIDGVPRVINPEFYALKELLP